MKTKNILIFVSTLITVFIFQNCGQLETLVQGETANNGSSLEDPIGDPPANDPPYLKGESFQPARIFRNKQNTDFSDKLINYGSGDNAYRAVAVNVDGDGLALKSWESDNATGQEEWNRVVQERCQLQYTKPCALIASGMEFVIDEADLASSFQDALSDLPSRINNGMRLPGQTQHQATQRIQPYLNDSAAKPQEFRAFYITTRGGAGVGWSSVSQADANRFAKEHCETMTYGFHPCLQYAEGMDIVFDSQNIVIPEMSVVFGPRPLMGPQDLILMQVGRLSTSEVATAISLHMEDPENFHFMILYARFGRSARIVTSSTPFTDADRDAALTSCNQDYQQAYGAEDNGFVRQCFIYSENMTVVLTAREYGEASHHWHDSILKLYFYGQ